MLLKLPTSSLIVIIKQNRIGFKNTEIPDNIVINANRAFPTSHYA